MKEKKKGDEETQEMLDGLTAQLEAKKAEMKNLEDKDKAMVKNCEDQQAEQAKTEADIAQTQKRFHNAEVLIDALGDEGVSWEDKLQILDCSAAFLHYSSFISSTYLNYIISFTYGYRK